MAELLELRLSSILAPFGFCLASPALSLLGRILLLLFSYAASDDGCKYRVISSLSCISLSFATLHPVSECPSIMCTHHLPTVTPLIWHGLYIDMFGTLRGFLFAVITRKLQTYVETHYARIDRQHCAI